MGELIVMPVRKTDAEPTKAAAECSEAQQISDCGIDFSVWKRAPKERTAAYFPTYSTVSKAMQAALRGWVREWFSANLEILKRPHTAYAILVYQCTHPFSGKPTNIFTYDIQQTEALNRAFASAAYRLGRELASLNTDQLGWFTREQYFAYRSKEVITYVQKNRRAIYKMLNVETLLMDAILKFAIIDIPKMGVDNALVYLRRVFNTQLRRFSDEFDLSSRSEELLRIVTDALLTTLPTDKVVAMPLAA
ncbi:MAG: hypothetical protein JO033_27795 [Acidobacteriaceae bacterium]|nr:hypothetical protein [Acidobacteriaceae bacterium]MBV9501229.1 hypothetical protein [Acidobacteriaceae bacterium]